MKSQTASRKENAVTNIVVIEMDPERREKWHRLSCAVIDLLRQEVTPAEAYAICKFCEQIIGDRYGIEKTELVQNATDLTQ